MTSQKPRLLKTSLSLDPNLMKEVNHACIDLDITISEACHRALRLWLRPEPLAIPEGNDRFLSEIMDIVNHPRNAAEKYLRDILKSAVNLRYIADEPITKRNTGGSRAKVE